MKKFFTLVLAAAAMLSVNAHPEAYNLPKLQKGTKIALQSPITDKRMENKESFRQFNNKNNVANLNSRANEAILYEAPGEEQFYSVASEGYYVYWSEIICGESTGMTTIKTDGNDVYIKNPLLNFKANTYAHGIKEDNKITLSLPQTIDATRYTQIYDDFPEYSYDETDVYELNLMQRFYFEEGGETYVSYEVVAQDNFVTYTISDDGSISLDMDGAQYDTEGNLMDYPEYILGVTYYTIDHLNGDQATLPSWGYYGDWAISYTVSSVIDEIATLPEGIEMNSNWLLYSDEGAMAVSVGFQDEKVYIIGFSKNLPESVIYGSYNAETNQYIFPNIQNLGYSSKDDRFLYMIGVNGQGEFADPVFDYDASTQRLVSAQDQTLYENGATDHIYYWECYSNPTFLYQTEVDMNAIPANPIFNYYNSGYNAFNFTMPSTNINGYVIYTDRIYYNVYANGKLYTFHGDQGSFYNRFTYEYYDSDEEFTNLTYAVFEFDFLYWFKNTLEICIPEEDIKSVGIQVFYEGTDGVLYRSDCVTGFLDGTYEITEDASSANTNIAIDGSISKVEYYNLAGLLVDNPNNGIFIKRIIRNDGSVKAQKVVIQ